MITAGVIGLGVGERHIQGFEKHLDCKVVALCDIDSEKKAHAARTYPQMAFHDRAEDLIDDPGVAIVSIASFDDAHGAQVCRALEAGKHVFVEKPLCLDAAEMGRIAALARERPRLSLGSNLILRASPRFKWLRQSIMDGQLGEIYYLEADYNYGRLHKLTDGWRGRIPYYSVTLGGAIHLVDLMRWLTGEEIVQVSALSVDKATRGSAFKHPDMVLATLKFESGMIGKVSANFGCVYPHFHRLSVYGTQATFENDLPDGRLYRSRDPEIAPEKVRSAYPGADKGDLLCEFVEDIVTGKDPEARREDVFRTMEACLAIDRASATGASEPVVPV